MKNKRDFLTLDCNENDLQNLLKECDFCDADFNPLIDIDEIVGNSHDEIYQHIYVPECEYIGCFVTTDQENDGAQVLLVTTLLKLLKEKRLKVIN